MITSTKPRQKTGRSTDRMREGMKIWTSFYRANPHRMAMDYLKCPLKPFQCILIYLMNKHNFFMFIASRGLGKSYLVAVYCCVVAILYPGYKIVVAAKTKEQAKLLITQKIEKELMNYTGSMLKYELPRDKIETGGNSAKVTFRNGSTIECVVSGEQSRGFRANILIIDEFRLVPKKIQDDILRPFLGVVYNPEFYNKPEYRNYPRLENKEIYMSSAWLKGHDSYFKFKGFISKMLEDGDEQYAVVDLPYTVARDEGFLTQARIDAIRNEEGMSEMSWQMEMEGIFFGESETAFYKLDEIEPCRQLKKAWIPPSDITFASEREKTIKKRSYYLPKQVGEKRIIGVDLALMGSSENDASIFTLCRLIPEGDYYSRQVVHIESCEGLHSEVQAIRLKQLFNDFEADTIVMDPAGNGLAVYDCMAKTQYDSDRDIEYPPFIAFNHDKMSQRSLGVNGLPCIYSIKVVQAEVNHQICMSLKDDFRQKKMKLLLNDIEAKNELLESGRFATKSPEDQATMLKSFVQTSALVNELVNLEYKFQGAFVKVYETGRNRKDRYSSLAYANYYARILDKELRKPDRSKDLPCLF